MYSAKGKIGHLFLAALCCLLVSSAVLAGEQVDADAPTAENLWKAQQAGDIEKAALIKAVMDEEAKKFWGGRADHGFVVETPGITPPENDDAFSKPYSWGNDKTIVLGRTANGISTDYDNSGNIYAARCTTAGGVNDARIRVYKSTDGGNSWSYPYLCSFYAPGSELSYPVVLTGTSGTPDKLYIFYLRSDNNGDIWVARYTLDGVFEGFYSVKVDSDTIAYFTACANYGIASTIIVSYERQRGAFYPTPWMYTIKSTNRGGTWGSQVTISSNGWHPDLGYGYNGYVYLAYTKEDGSDSDIGFIRSSDYGNTWTNFEYLTTDIWDDDFAKVAATHTTPVDEQYAWVAYNHDYANTGNWDMRYAYSGNAGVDWSKNHDLASDTEWDEIACDLWVGRKTNYVYVNICYLRYRFVSVAQRYYDVYYGYTNKYAPTTWYSHSEISDHRGAFSLDGREVCQGTYGDIATGERGVVYAGRDLYTNFRRLYFDSQLWTDVGDEMTQEGLPGEFSLSDNYPNPFNPETRIPYFVPRACQVKLEVFNVLGQKIRTLVGEHQTAGDREVSWDGRNEAGEQVASGVYFYKLEAEDFIQTKKMILIR
ncbi:MAG: T9SS type A sorting domain-containing protein [Candidatus Zixiibacteriota bacterium]|nr:MAG: T9SS type A sorting domain-containing protein [candidate division Zixibacteria bacterium]